MKVLSVGEVLWDVFEHTELLGGAPLNFAASISRLGDQLKVLSAVGRDLRGELALQQIEALGVSSEFIQITDRADTGAAMLSLDRQGNSSFLINRPAAYDMVELSPDLIGKLGKENFDWIYYGTLVHVSKGSERRLEQVLESSPGARGFYDVNLRTGHWDLALVERLSQKAALLKVNHHEAELLLALKWPGSSYSLSSFCAKWSREFGIQAICATLGAEGCAIWFQEALYHFPGYPVQVVDTVGAGDSFAAVFLHGFHHDWSMERTAHLANAVGALVASRPGALPQGSLVESESLVASRLG